MWAEERGVVFLGDSPLIIAGRRGRSRFREGASEAAAAADLDFRLGGCVPAISHYKKSGAEMCLPLEAGTNCNCCARIVRCCM